jgi:hypothetical protein
MTRISGPLHKNPHTCLIISHSFLLVMINFQDKFVRKIKPQILCPITFFFNLAAYRIMWKDAVEMGRPQMTIRHMRIACWIPKATNTHSDYVILVTF